MQPISLETWLALESDVRRPVPNMEATRYLEVEERVRDEVCRLFILSHYDVGTLMANVAQSLQHVGRHDVGLLRNENSTAFTLTQSAAYARQGETEAEQRRHAVLDAVERINHVGAHAERDFAISAQQLVNAPGAPAGASKCPTHTAGAAAASPALPPAFRKSAYEVLMEQVAAARRGGAVAGGRAASAGGRVRRPGTRNEGRTSAAAAAAASTNSYLLQRYSGNFDPQRQYSHYRYHGLPDAK